MHRKRSEAVDAGTSVLNWIDEVPPHGVVHAVAERSAGREVTRLGRESALPALRRLHREKIKRPKLAVAQSLRAPLHEQKSAVGCAAVLHANGKQNHS